MILYHGTDRVSADNIISRGVDIYCGNSRSDFGQGFYTTPDIRMAESWARRKGIFTRGAVVSFVFDESVLQSCVRARVFESADLIWAQFVANNRNGISYARRMRMADNNLMGQYDLVVGPTADGDVANITRRLEKAVEPVSQDVLSEFVKKRLSLQYSFHSHEAVTLLLNPRIRLI